MVGSTVNRSRADMIVDLVVYLSDIFMISKKKRSKLLNNCKPFDLCIDVNGMGSMEFIEYLFNDLHANDHLKARIDIEKYKLNLRCLMANLVKVIIIGYNPFLRIPLRPEHYRLSRYNPSGISYRAVRSLFEALLAEGYLRHVKGFRKETGLTKQTRTRCAKKLLVLMQGFDVDQWVVEVCKGDEIILLRDSKKKYENYEDAQEIEEWRKNLEHINEVLDKTWIDLYVKDTELHAINEQLNRDKDKQPIDFNRKRLRRIFNNSSFEQGGRFYHGWWQEIPKDYRQYVHVNGKMTVEVDYSWMHPLMLYGEYTGKQPNDDPYMVSTSANLSRDVCKPIFNILVNSKNAHEAYGAIGNELQKKGIEYTSALVQEIADSFVDKHKEIRDAFFSGEGIKLQRIDSEIAEKVMLRFIDMGYPILPVHDSFVIHQGLRDELDKVMMDVFVEVTGLMPKTDMKPTHGEREGQKRGEECEAISISDGIQDLIEHNQEYSGYYSRGTAYKF